LCKAGYKACCSLAEQEYYINTHHHIAPLYPPTAGVPVELHRALSRTLLERTRLGDLRSHAMEVCEGELRVLALDLVGTTLHGVIHCTDRPMLRDVFLLSQQLAEMAPTERVALQEALEQAGCDNLPARSALALAAQIAGLNWDVDARTARFVRWMLQREDLPRPLRMRPECVDAWFASKGSRAAALAHAAYERRTLRSALARVVTAVFIALYIRLMR
jgi:hypothetical protein